MTDITFRGLTPIRILEMADKASGPEICKHTAGRSFVQSSLRNGERSTLEDRLVVTETLPVGDKLDWSEILRQTYAQIAADTSSREIFGRTGSTALTAVITARKMLHLAHLGDCTALLLSQEPDSKSIEITRLTKEHHPADPVEKARIEAEGGRVDPVRLRVCREDDPSNTCANSRSFGDVFYRGVSKIPEIINVDLAKSAKKPVALVLVSDGVINEQAEKDLSFNTIQELIQFWWAHCPKKSLPGLLTAIAAIMRNDDNMSAIAVNLSSRRTADHIVGIYDGHGGIKAADIAMMGVQSMAYEVNRAMIKNLRQMRGR